MVVGAHTRDVVIVGAVNDVHSTGLKCGHHDSYFPHGGELD